MDVRRALPRNTGGFDRALRLGLGALLAGLALRQRRMVARRTLFGLSALGALSWATAYCPVNQALGRNTAD